MVLKSNIFFLSDKQLQMNKLFGNLEWTVNRKTFFYCYILLLNR